MNSPGLSHSNEQSLYANEVGEEFTIQQIPIEVAHGKVNLSFGALRFKESLHLFFN